jgi:hypothetical protein
MTYPARKRMQLSPYLASKGVSEIIIDALQTKLFGIYDVTKGIHIFKTVLFSGWIIELAISEVC